VNAVRLVADSLSVSFGAGPARHQALTNVSATFEPGRLTVVTGPSGSGKSTLLCALAGLLRPESGTVSLETLPISHLGAEERAQLRLEQFGFVYQRFRLLPLLSALENVELTMLLAGRDHAWARARALTLLTELGLAAKAGLNPGSLSGGEQQRVAIARALANDPPIVLADEPTASLDEHSAAAVMSLLTAVSREKVVVVVSHDSRVWQYSTCFVNLINGAVAPRVLSPGGSV
jgi:ABC-type lipoprotein export system ATPase subunit